jgi:tRNA(Ile)-lysidine synthase
MLKKSTKELLLQERNLLAFSAGVDSTALFFILHEAGIPFDIAIVDYGCRQQSKAELAYAQELAKKYNLQCHTLKAPPIAQNFEANARKIRYDFFESLIQKYSYKNLLTAHHLGDRLEWFFMQFCKGAGCLELTGMQERELRESYSLVRPLLHIDKEELFNYLHQNNIRYFVDASNTDERYTRNYFRKNITNPLLQKYKKGIIKSFEYLQEDKDSLLQSVEYKKCNALVCFESSTPRSDIYHIDKILKSVSHLMTAKERKLLQKEINLVVGRKYIVCRVQNYICIAPYKKDARMSKKFKEQMRTLKINPKLRGYLSLDSEAVAFLSLLLT